MKRLGLVIVLVFPLSLLASGFAGAADDSKVKAATNQVESGAKKIPDGKVGEGVEETAKGIGTTVSEGAKYSGEKLKERQELLHESLLELTSMTVVGGDETWKPC